MGMDNVYKLLSVLHDYAPSGEAQSLCTEQMRDMIRDGRPVREIEANLAESIAVGIRTGNWPWTDFSKREG